MKREGNHTYQPGPREAFDERVEASCVTRNGRETVLSGADGTNRSGSSVSAMNAVAGPSRTRLEEVIAQLRDVEDGLLELGSKQAAQLYRLTGTDLGFPTADPIPEVEPLLSEIERRLGTIKYLLGRSHEMSDELRHV